MASSVAPETTASNIACSVGDAVWWTISSFAIARRVARHPARRKPWCGDAGADQPGCGQCLDSAVAPWEFPKLVQSHSWEREMRFRLRRALPILLGVVLLTPPAAASAHGGGGGGAGHSLRAPLTGENFYFVMADRFENGRTDNDLGGLPADRLQSGFDPTHKGFYHGGDLAGIRQRLGYIRGLGTTAIWLTPSFKNRAVQLEDGPSAGYHGYWITDFTQIDPHLGTNAELAALIREAHGMGMKVFFDIITNHTADVIDYEEAHRPVYVSKDQETYRTAAGAPFDVRDYAGGETFPPLSRT